MQQPTLWRYSIDSVGLEGWAIFVLGSDGYFSAVSDYGNYAFMWGAHGCKDFREFLSRIDDDADYFVRKLSPGEVFDGEATEKEIRRHILNERRNRRISKKEAAEEWKLIDGYIIDSELEFRDWSDETRLEDVWELPRHSHPWDVRNFVAKCMTRLVPLLKADLDRGHAAGNVTP